MPAILPYHSFMRKKHELPFDLKPMLQLDNQGGNDNLLEVVASSARAIQRRDHSAKQGNVNS